MALLKCCPSSSSMHRAVLQNLVVTASKNTHECQPDNQTCCSIIAIKSKARQVTAWRLPAKFSREKYICTLIFYIKIVDLMHYVKGSYGWFSWTIRTQLHNVNPLLIQYFSPMQRVEHYKQKTNNWQNVLFVNFPSQHVSMKTVIGPCEAQAQCLHETQTMSFGFIQSAIRFTPR